MAIPTSQNTTGKESGKVKSGLLPGFHLSFSETFPSLKKVTTKLIETALEKASGNQVMAAYLLGMTPSALNKRLKKLNKTE